MLIYKLQDPIGKLSEKIRNSKKEEFSKVFLTNLEIKVDNGLFINQGKGLSEDAGYAIPHPVIPEEKRITSLKGYDFGEYKRGHAAMIELNPLHILKGEILTYEENQNKINKTYEKAKKAIEEKYGNSSIESFAIDELTYLIERTNEEDKVLDSVIVLIDIKSEAKVVRFPKLHKRSIS